MPGGGDVVLSWRGALLAALAAACLVSSQGQVARAGRAVVGSGKGAGGGPCGAFPCTRITDTGTDVATFTTNFGVTGVPDVQPSYYAGGGSTYWWAVSGVGNKTTGFTVGDTNFDNSTVYTPVSQTSGNANPLLSPQSTGSTWTLTNGSANVSMTGSLTGFAFAGTTLYFVAQPRVPYVVQSVNSSTTATLTTAYTGTTDSTHVATIPDQDYVGVGGWWTDGTTRYGVAHGENHQLWSANGATWASVGLVTRTADGYAGSTTLRSSVIISSDTAIPSSAPSQGIAGVGVPTPFIPPAGSPDFGDGYVYVYYLEMHANNVGSNQWISVARCLISSGCAPGNWTKFNSSWAGGTAGLGGASTQLVQHVDPSFGGCCQSVVWNTALQRYVLGYFTGAAGTTGGWYYLLASRMSLQDWSGTATRLFLNPCASGTGVATPVVMLFSPGQPYGTTGQDLRGMYTYLGTGTCPVTPVIPHMRKFLTQ